VTRNAQGRRMAITPSRFQELYEEYWGLVYTICFSRLGNREEAQDATQDVFVKNTENHCFDILRERIRRPERVEFDEEKFPLRPAGDDDVVTHVEITRCLDCLSDQDRQLALMKMVEENTWEEIATTTGLTVAQARVRTARALTELRTCLAAKGIEAGE